MIRHIVRGERIRLASRVLAQGPPSSQKRLSTAKVATAIACRRRIRPRSAVAVVARRTSWGGRSSRSPSAFTKCLTRSDVLLAPRSRNVREGASARAESPPALVEGSRAVAKEPRREVTPDAECVRFTRGRFRVRRCLHGQRTRTDDPPPRPPPPRAVGPGRLPPRPLRLRRGAALAGARVREPLLLPAPRAGHVEGGRPLPQDGRRAPPASPGGGRAAQGRPPLHHEHRSE